MQLRVAAIQPTVIDDLNQNIEVIMRLIRTANNNGVDIAVLPELWIHSRPMEKINQLASASDLIVRKLMRIAKMFEVAIIGGGIYIHEESHVKIGCPVINQDGELLGIQHKLHLINEERSLISPGDRFDIFKIMGTTMGIAICHDIVYPEYIRILALKSAEIILNPSRIMTSGIKPWHLYLQVRSLENRVPIIAPNIWIKGRFGGNSMIVKPTEKAKGIYVPLCKVSRNGSSALVDVIETENLKKARMDRLLARRPDIYSDVINEFLIEGKEDARG
ncbi:MAG: carbon-nitrogen hydrolase family protein [Nitrososphaerota archaeon]